MNILLTGSGGFIGKNLKEYLKDKYTLLCPRSLELDLTDENAVKKYFLHNKIDFIMHCGSVGGARGIDDRDSTIDDNLSMVNNLIKYKNNGVRIILFGSGAMYDKSRNLHKVKESEIGQYIPHDLYGQSKMRIAQSIKKYSDILCLNIFACYGYGEKANRFPSYVINQVLNGEDVVINQNAVFDYLFVEDMQKIVEHFIKYEPENKIINISPTQSISLFEIAEIINNFSDKKVNIFVKNKVLCNEYTGDNSLLLSEIPDFQFTTMESGLKKLYLYMQDNLIKI